MDEGDEYLEAIDPDKEVAAPQSAGFMKFYGIYWRKDRIADVLEEKILPGLPAGWVGKGKIAKGFDRSALWVNFWDQKGVYVLYDDDLTPVYTGQAGLIRGKGGDDAGRTLGERIRDHMNGRYRNGWRYFSWFGFLSANNEKVMKNFMREASQEALQTKRFPEWKFLTPKKDMELNLLLDSFEAILIEAFTPRFNSRGGNLKGASYVNQLETSPTLPQNE